MKQSRAIVGAVAGAAIALVWQILGGQALLWTVLFGVVGGLIGLALEHPGRLISFLQGLERE